jgi:uncharacterized damage-inducible protein DinB
MKAYFIRLFNYDHYANLLIVSAILQTKEHEKAEQLMAHMLAAQQVWLARCKAQPVANAVLWPDWKADTFKEMINDNHHKWIILLENLKDNDFERPISYKNLKGDAFENKLTDILGHVINHGTHHRAQAGQHLKVAGTDLPITDYIFYLRENMNG